MLVVGRQPVGCRSSYDGFEGRFMKQYTTWLSSILGRYGTSANSIERSPMFI